MLKYQVMKKENLGKRIKLKWCGRILEGILLFPYNEGENACFVKIDGTTVCWAIRDLRKVMFETPDNIEKEINILNDKITEADKIISVSNNKIAELRNICSHEDLDINNYGTATCKICGKHFSWYCPTSPTLECDYNQEDGSYDEDHCRYCGQPEERK